MTGKHVNNVNQALDQLWSRIMEERLVGLVLGLQLPGLCRCVAAGGSTQTLATADPADSLSLALAREKPRAAGGPHRCLPAAGSGDGHPCGLHLHPGQQR